MCVLVKSTWFVCVEVLRPSQPNGVMSRAVSLPNHMFTGQTYSKWLTSIVYILLPEKVLGLNKIKVYRDNVESDSWNAPQPPSPLRAPIA